MVSYLDKVNNPVDVISTAPVECVKRMPGGCGDRREMPEVPSIPINIVRLMLGNKRIKWDCCTSSQKPHAWGKAGKGKWNSYCEKV